MRRAVAIVGVVLVGAAGCGGTKGSTVSVGAALPAAYTATIATKTAKVSFTLNVSSASKGHIVSGTGNGAIDFAAKSGQLQFGVGLPGARNISLDEVVANGEVFIHLPQQAQAVLGGKPWVGVQISGLIGTTTASGVDPSQILALLASHANSVTKMGIEPVDGVSTTHYRALVDPTKLPVNSDPALHQILGQLARSSGGQPIAIDVWIDGQGRARRLATTVTLSSPPAAQASQPNVAAIYPITSAVSMDFSDFGTPVHVTVPPADEVANIPLDQLLSPTKGG